LNATVLIVDDEKLLRQGFIHMADWQREGFEIVGEASNGVDALQQIGKVHPHIVVTDIKMPYMDGIELTKAIKTQYGEQIQVIVLSSFNDYEYVKETLKSGAVDYILKPRMKVSELLDALGKAKERFMDQSLQALPASGVVSLEIDYKLVKECLGKLDFQPLNVQISKMLSAGTEPTRVRRHMVRLIDYVVFLLSETGIKGESPESKADLWVREIEQAADISAALNIMVSRLNEAVAEHKLSTAWSPTIRKVIAYIQAHYTEDISLDSLARQFFLNKSYLSQLFKRNTGETLQGFIARLRIEKAMELLVQRAANVNDAANEVGYANPGYFGKVFKSIVGISPSEYCKKFMK